MTTAMTLRALLRVSAALLAVAPVTARAADDEGLDEIVVTAERRSENLQKVPLSVAVIGGELARSFTSGGDDTLLSLSGRVPSLYVESTTGRIFPRFYIRGLGNVDFYLGASQPVSIIQDDVVLEHVVLKSNPVYDLAQVEVLRGPQGSLFGRNTTAGIIKFDTIRPSQTLEGRGQASYGSFNTVTLDAGVGGPLVADKVAVRISGLFQHRDDWIDNVYTGPSADRPPIEAPKKNALGGFDERDVRLQVLLTPTERLSILGSGHGRWFDGTSTPFYRAALVRGSNDVSNVARDRVAFDEAANNPQGYDSFGGSVKLGYDFGAATLTAISAYETTSGFSRGDTDGGAAANFGGIGFGESQGQIRDLDQYSQEVRLASNGTDRFKWQFGGIYFDSRDFTDFYQRAFFTGVNPNNFVQLRNVNISYAGFGQASYQLLDRLTITGGVRVTRDSRETTLLKTANTAANIVTYRGRRYVRLTDTQPSWDVSALYQVEPNLSVYARIARGFRGPTIQGRSAVFNADFTTASSETILSYEAGFKSSLFGNTLRLNATGFAYTVDNIQLNGNDSNGNGVLFNAAKARAYGLEADAEWRPIERLSVTAGVSLLHTKIEDSRVFAQVCALAGVVVCTVNDPTIRVGANTFAQIDGNPLPNAPKYNLNFTARYGVPVGRYGEVFIATDWNVQGFTNLVLYRTAEFYSKDNFEGGAKLGFVTADGKYEAAVFARNITDEKNLKGVIENFNAAVFNEPRVVGVALSAKLR